MAIWSLGPTECERRARSNSVIGRDADRFGSASLVGARPSAAGFYYSQSDSSQSLFEIEKKQAKHGSYNKGVGPTLTLCLCSADPEELLRCVPRLEGDFLRPNRRPRVLRKVDLLR